MDNLEFKKNLLIINDELNSFEDELKLIVNKEKNFLSEKLNKFLFTNPKRLRPIFVFLFAKILNINSSYAQKFTQKIALGLELIHSASLIHDDILDEDKTRRCDSSFYVEYNTKLAILEGDFLLSLALFELSKTNIEIVQIFSTKIIKTIQGEILQNENTNKIIDFETYYSKTFLKTGNLFMAGLESLFALNKSIDENLLEFMKNYSLAFQIKNDIDNFISCASDIKNGNYTLPVLYFNMGYVDYLSKAKEKMLEYKNIALKSLENFEKNDYINALINIAEITLGE